MISVNDESSTQAFPQKAQSTFMENFHSLIDSQEFSELINWAEKDASFTIHKPIVFAKVVVPILCKHSNLLSFIRQMNMYGFKKCKRKNDGDAISYSNPYFVKGKPELLKNIIRKNPRQILAQKKAKRQQSGLELNLTKLFPRCKQQSQMTLSKGSDPTSSFESQNQPIQTKTINQEKQRDILSFMNQMIDELSTRSDIRTMSMIRNYLKDDDNINENRSDLTQLAKKHKKLQRSPENSSTIEGVTQYVQIDFRSLDYCLFESEQTKTSLNSQVSKDSLVLD